MSDLCCGPGTTNKDADHEVGEGPARLWQVRELQLAALAAVFLAVAWLLGGQGPIVITIELVGAVVAASTFVPEALRNLRHRRIGVGTLMTIAALGAVALGRAQAAARIATPLVPGIMILAALVAVLGAIIGDPMLWLERALVVLIAASPCALAISVPLTVVAAIGAASRHGALVKGGAALEELGRIRAVALDKDGRSDDDDARRRAGGGLLVLRR